MPRPARETGLENVGKLEVRDAGKDRGQSKWLIWNVKVAECLKVTRLEFGHFPLGSNLRAA